MRYLITFFALIVFAMVARADEDGAALKVYRELCASGAAEGTYLAQLGTTAKFRINIFCTGPEALAASIRSADDSIMNGLVHTAVDDDKISFVTFHLSGDDAKTMSAASLDARLSLSLSSLRRGILKGAYHTTYRVDDIPISANRESSFVNLYSHRAQRDFGNELSGSFDVNGGANHSFVLRIETIGGIQRVNINYPGLPGFALFNGLNAKEAGDVFYATSGVDDGAFGKVSLQHVRGRLVTKDELEVYVLDAKGGMSSPLRARRRTSVAHPPK